MKSADKKDGVGQLQSYMAACPNVTYGMWTNGLSGSAIAGSSREARSTSRTSLISRVRPRRGGSRSAALRSAQTCDVRCPALRLPALPQLHCRKPGPSVRPRINTATWCCCRQLENSTRSERVVCHHYYALLSVIFMMGFVCLFDCMHVEKWKIRFCNDGLLSSDEIDRLRKIMLACQES